jgi:hypothetical protein
MCCNEELMDELASKWDPGHTLTLEGLDALVEAQKEKVEMAELRMRERMKVDG